MISKCSALSSSLTACKLNMTIVVFLRILPLVHFVLNLWHGVPHPPIPLVVSSLHSGNSFEDFFWGKGFFCTRGKENVQVYNCMYTVKFTWENFSSKGGHVFDIAENLEGIC